jgi:uncharacterized protein Smg (DUF494 family)
MKETLFEMLLSLFETTLLRLKEVNGSESPHTPDSHEQLVNATVSSVVKSDKISANVYHLLVLKDAKPNALRVYTPEERMKLSKASYQFLMQLNTWGYITRDLMELIIHRLLLSDSYIVSLQETKLAIRAILADKLTFDQLAYLDLLLYHKEDAIVQH